MDQPAAPAETVVPPSRLLFALEGQRALLELGWFVQASPLMRLLPRGDGHPVLVLPGFTASDGSTMPLRRVLRRLGYPVRGWALGRNLGPNDRLELNMLRRLDYLSATYGEKVSVIGWSLGGIYARELARQRPDLVRQVISLGSPFAQSPRATNVWRLFERISGQRAEEIAAERMAEMAKPPPVPSTAIYSKTDGVAHWRACREPEAPLTDNVQIPGSHCGLGFNPLAVYVIADRLAQAEAEWRPFRARGLAGVLLRGDRAASRNGSGRNGSRPGQDRDGDSGDGS